MVHVEDRDVDLASPRDRMLRGRDSLEQACAEAGVSRQELELGSRYGWTLAESARRLGGRRRRSCEF